MYMFIRSELKLAIANVTFDQRALFWYQSSYSDIFNKQIFN